MKNTLSLESISPQTLPDTGNNGAGCAHVDI